MMGLGMMLGFLSKPAGRFFGLSYGELLLEIRLLRELLGGQLYQLEIGTRYENPERRSGHRFNPNHEKHLLGLLSILASCRYRIRSLFSAIAGEHTTVRAC